MRRQAVASPRPTVTNHSIGMLTDDGEEAAHAYWPGTVAMNGKGFTCHVQQGDIVKAGTPLHHLRYRGIKAAGYEDVVTIIISNTGENVRVNHVGQLGHAFGRPSAREGGRRRSWYASRAKSSF